MANFLFGSNPNPTVETTSSTLGPAWYNAYLQAIASKASDIAGEPYQPYTGQRIADVTPDQTSAYNLTRSAIGSYQPMLDTANSYLTRGGGGFDQGEFDKYMNPYVDSVVNRISELGARNLSENLLPAVNSTFTSAGQFGSSRNADFTNRALRDTQDSILGAQSSALSSGFNTALSGYNAGQDRALQAGQGLTNLAGQDQSLGLKDAAALETIGQEQQNQQQKNLDLGYNDFIQQRDYPRTNISFLTSALRGTNPGTTTTTNAPLQQSQMAPTALGQIAGLGTAALGIYGLGSKLGFFKRGGAVRRYADGGDVDGDAPPEPPRKPASGGKDFDVFQMRFPDQKTKDAYLADIQTRIAKERQRLKDAQQDRFLFGRLAISGDPAEISGSLDRLMQDYARSQDAAIGFARGGPIRAISHYARGGSVMPRRPVRVNQGTPRFQPRAYRNAISAIGAA